MNPKDLQRLKGAIKAIKNSNHIFHRTFERSWKIIEELIPDSFVNKPMKDKLNDRE